MNEACATLLETLSVRNWSVVRAEVCRPLLPPEVAQRYLDLPADLVAFLEGLDGCINPKGTVWFLTASDYHGIDPRRMPWNALEQMSLEAAQGDSQLADEIRSYWDHHFPFLFAVHSDYDYLAVSLAPETSGQIVHGFMPEPEVSSPVAGSFADFVRTVQAALRAAPPYPLSLFFESQ